MSRHYVGFFTQTRGVGKYQQQRAVCGTWVSPSDHTAEPSCPQCLDWLIQDAEEHKVMSIEWAREDALKVGKS